MSSSFVLPPLRDYPFRVRPLLVAHRGDKSGGATENSLEAIAAAVQSGAEMVEIDVQITKDNIAICYHDAKTPEGNAVEELTFLQFSEECIRAGLTAPTLLSVIEYIRGKAYLNIELKEYSKQNPKEVLALVGSMLEVEAMLDFIIISSFRIDLILAAGWLALTVIIHAPEEWVLLYPELANRELFAQPDELPSEIMLRSGATGYACTLGQLSPVVLADLKKHNFYWTLYTIYGEGDFRAAMSYRPCGIVCENISEARALMNEIIGNSKGNEVHE